MKIFETIFVASLCFTLSSNQNRRKPTRPPQPTCNPQTEFACGDGTCVDISERCDRTSYHCADGTDEFDCEDHTPAPRRCKPYQEFTCRDGTCVDIERKCDGRFDCSDRSDERRCGIPTRPSQHTCDPRTEFTCGDGTCVDISGRCDRTKYDCADGTDEFYCESAQQTTVPSTGASASPGRTFTKVGISAPETTFTKAGISSPDTTFTKENINSVSDTTEAQATTVSPVPTSGGLIIADFWIWVIIATAILVLLLLVFSVCKTIIQCKQKSRNNVAVNKGENEGDLSTEHFEPDCETIGDDFMKSAPTKKPSLWPGSFLKSPQRAVHSLSVIYVAVDEVPILGLSAANPMRQTVSNESTVMGRRRQESKNSPETSGPSEYVVLAEREPAVYTVLA